MTLNFDLNNQAQRNVMSSSGQITITLTHLTCLSRTSSKLDSFILISINSEVFSAEVLAFFGVFVFLTNGLGLFNEFNLC